MYAGLTPTEKSSVRGKPKVVGGGQLQLRKMLYLAALSASWYNPPIKAFYERLKARGKGLKVARCAAALKLLHQAFALVKSSKPFQAEYQGGQAGTLLEALSS